MLEPLGQLPGGTNSGSQNLLRHHATLANVKIAVVDLFWADWAPRTNP
jgi:hypothetical protein